MAKIENPNLIIQLDQRTPNSIVVSEDDPKALAAQVRALCDVSFDDDIGIREAYHLTIDLYGVDGTERTLLTEFHWCEINRIGDIIPQRRVRFHSLMKAGQYQIERWCHVSQEVLDEDPPEPFYSPWGTFDLRQTDEIEAEFNLIQFTYPSNLIGWPVDTKTAAVEVRI